MDDYSKEKWSADFPDRAGQEVRPTEAVENTLDYDVLFPQYLSEDPVVFNQQNKTVSQLVSNDARLYERISATAADINAHLTDANAHATGISGNAASAEAGTGPRSGIRPTSTAEPSTDATISSRAIARHHI